MKGKIKMLNLFVKINTFLKYQNLSLISKAFKYLKESTLLSNNSKINSNIKKMHSKIKSLNLKYSSNWLK